LKNIADNGYMSAEIRGIADYSPHWPKSEVHRTTV